MNYAKLTPQTRLLRLTSVLVFLAGSIIDRTQNEYIAAAFSGAGNIVIAPSINATNIDATGSPSSASIISNNIENALASLGKTLANVVAGTLSTTDTEAVRTRWSRGSPASRDNSISLGYAGGERQITNVASGSRITDAVNVEQLNRSVANATGEANDLQTGVSPIFAATLRNRTIPSPPVSPGPW